MKRELLGGGRTRKSKQAGFWFWKFGGVGSLSIRSCLFSCSPLSLSSLSNSFVTLGEFQGYGRGRSKVEEWLTVGMIAFRYLASSQPS